MRAADRVARAASLPHDSDVAAVAGRLRLLAEIRADRSVLADRDTELDRFLEAWAEPDDVHAAALAFVLARTCTILEAIVERILVVLDGDATRTLDWGGALGSASLEVPAARPPILATSAPAVDELRRFRHFVGHACAAPLDAARVRELARHWQAARASVASDLDHFEELLEGLVDRLDES
jgi:hypothetical protein